MHELWLSFIPPPGLDTLQNTTVDLSTSHCTFIACNMLLTLKHFFFFLRSDVYELDQRFHLSDGFNTARELLFPPSYFKIESCSLGTGGAFLNADPPLCT